MNKKEILEIRKQFSPENCAITRICGCYVDGDQGEKNGIQRSVPVTSGRRILQIL